MGSLAVIKKKYRGKNNDEEKRQIGRNLYNTGGEML
jgi:hypothetical protein